MAEPSTPGYVYDFSSDLGNGRMLLIRGNFPLGATAEQMNGEIDKLRKVMDRQIAKSSVEEWEKQVYQGEALLAANDETIKALDKKWEGKNMPTVDKTARDNAFVSMARVKTELEWKRKKLEEVRKEAA